MAHLSVSHNIDSTSCSSDSISSSAASVDSEVWLADRYPPIQPKPKITSSPCDFSGNDASSPECASQAWWASEFTFHPHWLPQYSRSDLEPRDLRVRFPGEQPRPITIWELNNRTMFVEESFGIFRPRHQDLSLYHSWDPQRKEWTPYQRGPYKIHIFGGFWFRDLWAAEDNAWTKCILQQDRRQFEMNGYTWKKRLEIKITDCEPEQTGGHLRVQADADFWARLPLRSKPPSKPEPEESEPSCPESELASDMSQTKKRSHRAYLGLPAAIFIHAGAGFHSLQNEKFHLSVCSEAAAKAMKILNADGSAVDAVEAAIKHLEDHEITNAGYGSNLTIDGTVECDATIVDHLGRSGACGAVSNIKNPISLAKIILETSSKTLSLRRVPPNFLVGEGAKRFGEDHGIALVTNEQLVSRNARDRFQKWRADLDKVTPTSSETGSVSPHSSTYGTDTAEDRHKGKEDKKMGLGLKARKGQRGDHQSALMYGLSNEGQPDSPSSETRSPLLTGLANSTTLRSGRTISSTPATPSKRAKSSPNTAQDNPSAGPSAVNEVDVLDGASSFRLDVTELTAEPTEADMDMVTDTIGAIAIDMHGNIAAGSSSGGIGMKHMGRTGPAALVGVGTAVIPFDEEDDDFKSVATVTSGTGEHMAATMAAQKCADRLYQSTRRGKGGVDVKDDDVSAVLQSFVEKDFMGHPGVKNQASARAIGVMAVEVTSSGIYVHWAHNTESFALASMSADDKQPKTVMSRLPEGNCSVNIGARKIMSKEYDSEGEGWII